MILAIAVVAVLAQQPISDEKPSEVMSKMLAHYSNAKSIIGEIVLTQTAQDSTVQITTKLQYDKPNQIFLDQIVPQRRFADATERFLNSDGKTFSYSKADFVVGPDVFQEKVAQHGVDQDIQQLYAVVRPALKDTGPILECAIGRRVDLQSLLAQWATLGFAKVLEVNGKDVRVITGKYRTDARQQPTGTYAAYIDPNYNFVKYVLSQNVQVPDSDVAVNVVSTWVSTLVVDGKTDPKLYRG